MRMIYDLTACGVTPDAGAPQTHAIQKVLDFCKENGGTVVFPKGTYRVSGLLLYSDTTVLLKSGAVLLGSENCDDYEVFDVPENVSLRTDQELIPQYFGNKKRAEYRRAMLSAYGARNISIIGEPGAVIDGQNCFDPDGEEHYRGPHGIFLSNCENVVLKGYTVRHSGNFMHQLDACENVSMTDVTCLGGSDGIHLHCCKNVEINRCVFRTGDDCIAGINVRDLHVNNCVLNSSCQAFRIGGVNILAENCHVYGPGYYPHRVGQIENGDPAPGGGKTQSLRNDDLFCQRDLPCAGAFPRYRIPESDRGKRRSGAALPCRFLRRPAVGRQTARTDL